MAFAESDAALPGAGFVFAGLVVLSEGAEPPVSAGFEAFVGAPEFAGPFAAGGELL